MQITKKKKATIGLLAVLMSGIAGFWIWKSWVKPDETLLKVNGNIEVTDAELSFKISGRVEKVLFSEGEKVKSGDVVARMEDNDIKHEVALRKAEAERLKLEFARQKELHQKKSISTREFEAAKAAWEIAKESLALAETRLGYATLTSPMSGLILSDHIESGEYAAPGTPVLTVGDMENVWLRAYIGERDLGRVMVGQTVHVRSDTFPDKKYTGRLSFISSEAEFTPKNVQTKEERVKLVYRIKVDIHNPNMELKPGMPVEADIVLTSLEKNVGEE